LRTSLNGNHENPTGQTLLVTSASSGEGKSTVSTNLAVSMANAGRRVVLIDCDLHLPKLHELLKLPNDKGLSDVLSKGEDCQAVIQHTDIPTLDVMTAGPYVSNPTDLLGSARWCELEKQLQQDYPVIILDGPPILAVSDSLVLAPSATGILLVVDQRKSSQQTVSAAREQLDKVRKSPVGVIFNRAPADASFNEYKSYASRVHRHA
jgi:capsular exopolysaccharide synthesis family protein